MRIAYFNYMGDLYGSAIGSTIKAKVLMNALAERGHEVRMFWRKEPDTGGAAPQNGAQGSPNPVKEAFARYLFIVKALLVNIRYMREEARILREMRPDLLVVRLDICIFSALVLARWFRLSVMVEADSPVVYEWRNFVPQRWLPPVIPEFLEKLNLRFADGAFMVSNQAKGYFLRYGLRPDRIRVITNGARPFDVSSATVQKLRKELGLVSKTVIGFVGSFHRWHGVDALKELIRGTLEEFSESAFLLVGSGGPLEEEIKQAAAGMEDRVVFAGLVPHEKVPAYIGVMDVVLAPYPALDFFYYSPMKVYEYMAAGKPVVSSRIGQIAELIEDEENGLLVEPGHVTEMRSALFRLLGDQPLCQRISQGAAETISEFHTWPRKAQELEDFIYLRLACRQGKV